MRALTLIVVLALIACERKAPPPPPPPPQKQAHTVPAGLSAKEIAARDVVEAIAVMIEIRAEMSPAMSMYGIGVLLEGPLPRPGVAGELAYLDALAEEGVFEATAKVAAIENPLTPTTRPEQRLSDIDLGGPLTNSSARRLFRVQQSRMRVAAVEGDVDTAVRALDEALAHAQWASTRLTISDRIRASGMQIGALMELMRELDEGLYDAEACRRLLEVLDRRADFVEFEALIRAATETHSSRDYWESALSRREIEAMEDIAARALQQLDLPANELTDLGGLEYQSTSLAERLETTLKSERMRMLFCEASRLRCAIELHRQSSGAFPATLDALVPDVLDSLPVDPISGLGLQYRLTDTGCLLYSVGYDATDNHGVAGEDHIRFRAHQGDPSGYGYDWVLTEPRGPVPTDD